MRTLHRGLPCLLLGWWIALAGMPAFAADITEYELKAALLYKFAQFTTWRSLPATEFTLCVLGENPFGDELDKLVEKKLFQLPVKIKHPASAEAARPCQIAYLNPDGRRELAKWVGAFGILPILTISDAPDAWREEVMIVFTVEPNGVKFKINLTAARAAGFTLNAQMLRLAQEVR